MAIADETQQYPPSDFSGNTKREDQFLEDIEQTKTRATYLPATNVSPEHQEYLLQRHGTTQLDPLPGFGDADPYNWPQWKKVTNLILVAFHAAMSTMVAGAIIPAYANIAEDLNVSTQQATYLTSLQIAILGVAPLVWKPFSSRYGRRPVFLLSLLCSIAGNIGCAKSPTYATMAVCRAIVAFFISPAGAIGSAVVTEMFFRKERARYLGIWTLLVTLGVPIGPLIFGFVTNSLGYRWIFWILAMINGGQLILYLFLGPESRYLRKGVLHEGSSVKQEYLTLKRIDPKPLTFWEFVQPLSLGRYLFVLLPACAYSMNFLFGSIMVTVELPQLFQEKFDLNPAKLGLQFLAVIIGSVLGEQLGGYLSDIWMSRRTRKTGTAPAPEYRLWLSYSGFLLTIVGSIVFLVRTQQAADGHWNITPLIGVAISGCGNQIVTTVLITYAVDCLDEESASVGVFITFVRQIWGFIGPFWFPSLFDNVGVANSAGVAAALIVGVGIIPTIVVQWRGQKWRWARFDSPYNEAITNRSKQ